MPQQQRAGTAVTIQGSDDGVAEGLPAVVRFRSDPLDVPSVPAEPSFAEVGDAVDPLAVERAAVDVDHRLELGEVPIAPRADAVTDRERVHRLGR